MKKLLSLALFAVLAIGFSSCSEDKDDSNPITPTTKNYFPMKAGNYWVYEDYTRDMNNAKQLDTKETDSVVITGSEIYLNKDSYVFAQFTDGTPGTPYHHALDGAKLLGEFYYFMPVGSSFSIPVDKFENKWVTAVDPNISSWEINSAQFADIILDLDLPIQVKLAGTLTMKASRGTEVDITIGNSTVKAQEFIVKNIIDAKANGLVDLDLELVSHYYYADGIGLVKSTVDSKSVTLSIPLFGSQTIDINGHESTLLRYNIVK